MDWKAIETITAIVCAVAALASSWSALSMRAAILQLQLEMERSRAADKKEVESKITGLSNRLMHIEHKLQRAS